MDLTIDKLREKLKNLTQPVNDKLKEVKEGADDFLNENVNVPLAERGYPKLGAGISAAGSAAVDFAVPDSVEEGALSLAAGPIGRVAGKLGKAERLGAMALKEAPAVEKIAAKEVGKLTYPGAAGVAERSVAKAALNKEIEQATARQDWKKVRELTKRFDEINNPKYSTERE